jgi:hypothetical protein
VVLITTEWQLNWVKERNPGVEFLVAPPSGAAPARDVV